VLTAATTRGTEVKRVEPITYIELADGTTRPVFLDDGRQFVIDDDGERVYGEWFIPEPEHYDVPIIIGPDVLSFDEIPF
jgi:hypothetical protein